MSSTNKTAHYELSQYSANDKPTYLVDYNGDMSKIDTGIYDAQSTANGAESSIGVMTNLNTTDKSSLVGAINEVNTQVGTNTGNISTLNTAVSANTGNIGTMANLNTTDKTSLVGAVNEVNTTTTNKINNFNLTHFYNYTTSDVSLTGASLDSCDISLATNDDGSLAKIYGTISFENITQNGTSAYIQTPLRPTQDIVINGGMLVSIRPKERVTMKSYKLLTDGRIEFDNIRWYYSSGDEEVYNCINSLIFVKDFGDVPTPNSI